MKKAIISAVLLIFVLLTGCSNEFAKEQYDDTDLIISSVDRYAKTMAVMSSADNKITFTAQQFDGRETIWSGNYEEYRNVDVEFTFSISSGKAKLVFIDSEGKLENIAEITPDSVIDVTMQYTALMREGVNRIKLVGYDCKDLELNMELKEWFE